MDYGCAVVLSAFGGVAALVGLRQRANPFHTPDVFNPVAVVMGACFEPPWAGSLATSRRAQGSTSIR